MYLLLWMGGLGVLGVPAIGAALVPPLLERVRLPDRPTLRRTFWGAWAILLAAFSTLEAVQTWRQAADYMANADPDPLKIVGLSNAVQTVLPPDPRRQCLVRIVDRDAWPAAAGLYYATAQDGRFARL